MFFTFVLHETHMYIYKKKFSYFLVNHLVRFVEFKYQRQILPFYLLSLTSFLAFCLTVVYLVVRLFVFPFVSFAVLCTVRACCLYTKIRTMKFVENFVMVLILNFNSVIGAHVRSNLYHFICLRHLIRSRAVTNRIFFSPKRPFFSSSMRIMFWITI